MDSIWLCVTTMLLHVLINRLFGRLGGAARWLQWPVMQLSAMAAHAVLVSAPIVWLLQWIMPLTGLSARSADVALSMLAAGTGALAIRTRRSGKQLFTR